MPARKMRSIAPGRRRVYEELGETTNLSKESRARIANAGKTRTGRQRMARKAVATRKRRGR